MTDANKNVRSLVDESGQILAEYEYDAFGQILSATGTLADVNPFRFSSEFHDDETGLVYYNYRYYSPTLGRWLSRDPIEEQGGVNLYGMVNNDPVNKWDHLGLAKGEVLWIMYIPERLKQDIVIKSVRTLALLEKSKKLKPFFVARTGATPPKKFGQQSDSEYLDYLLKSGALKDECWDRVYIGRLTMDTTKEGLTALSGYLEALGYGNAWTASIYHKKVEEAWKQAQEDGQLPPGANIDNWIFVAIMHEIMHSVGLKHLKEGDFNSIDLMRPTGSYEWSLERYDLSKSAQQFLAAFGIK